MAIPNPITGAIGGWWSASPAVSVSETNYLMRAALGTALIAEFDFVLNSVTTVGGIVTAVDYNVILRYRGASGTIILTANKPIPDPAIGKTTSGTPRATWCAPWRFALTFKCSTWDGSIYAADGAVHLYMNGNLLLSAVDVLIPRRFNLDANIQYSLSPFLDCDRVWARVEPTVLPTNPDGSMIGAVPADLLFFEDFNNGVYPDWTVFSFNPGIGNPTPYPFATNGGGGSWGISTYCCLPEVATCDVGLSGAPFVGLTRVANSDIEPPDPPEPELGGVYKMTLGKTHDTLFTTHDPTSENPAGGITKAVKIPDPFATSFLIGNE